MAPATMITVRGKNDNVLGEKDDVERQLESLVFGDDEAFHENIRRAQAGGENLAHDASFPGPVKIPGVTENDDLEELDDSDVR